MKERIDNIQHLKEAFNDYLMLLDMGYPRTATLKLVGDRYRLIGEARHVLYRGAGNTRDAEFRMKRLTTNISGEEITIDGYNVLFTIMNYRLGKHTFISNDGFLRDVGRSHGRVSNEAILYEAFDILVDFLLHKHVKRVTMYLDTPVSNSGSHKGVFDRKMRDAGIPFECHIVKSADFHVAQTANGLIAGSDTEVIQRAVVKSVDLARLVLENRYKCEFFNLKNNKIVMNRKLSLAALRRAEQLRKEKKAPKKESKQEAYRVPEDRVMF